MGILGALGFKAKRTGEQMEDGLLAWLRKADPDTMDAYQLQEYDDVLQKLSLDMVKAQRHYDEDNARLTALVKSYNEKVDDVQAAQAKIVSSTTTLELKGKLEAHRDALLKEMDGMSPTIEEEKEHVRDALEEFTELKTGVEEAAKRLLNARKMLEERKRELSKLDREAQRLKEKEEQQRVLDGIKRQTDSFGTIVTSYDKEIQQKKLDLDAAKARVAARDAARGKPEGEIDPEVAAALGKTKESEPKQPILDRIANLKKL